MKLNFQFQFWIDFSSPIQLFHQAKKHRKSISIIQTNIELLKLLENFNENSHEIWEYWNPWNEYNNLEQSFLICPRTIVSKTNCRKSSHCVIYHRNKLREGIFTFKSIISNKSNWIDILYLLLIHLSELLLLNSVNYHIVNVLNCPYYNCHIKYCYNKL